MVIFGTGVVTGGLLVRQADHGLERRPQRAGSLVHPAQGGPAGMMRIEFLRRMERELNLTSAQRDPADRILKDGQDRMKKLMDTVEPRRREEYKRTMEEFQAVLTPEQHKQFDELVKQQQQRAREQRKAAPPRDHLPQNPPIGNAPAATNP